MAKFVFGKTGPGVLFADFNFQAGSFKGGYRGFLNVPIGCEDEAIQQLNGATDAAPGGASDAVTLKALGIIEDLAKAGMQAQREHIGDTRDRVTEAMNRVEP
jgi:hypothetical protein